ncbi:MAG: hypothetical protein ACKO1U_08425 [Bacteroidota bacterium]
MLVNLSFTDLIVPPLFLALFYFIAQNIVKRRIASEPYYRYFLPGLFMKLFGGLALCLIYIFYFKGGDTLFYFNDGTVISKLFLKNPWQAIRFSFQTLDADMWFAMDDTTGWLLYSYDERAMMVDKLTWPLSFLSFNSYIAETFLLNFIIYFSIWRLFKMFVYEIPGIEKQFAFSVLFIPSVVFWGSGLLKDSITFACVAQYAASFHHLIKIKKKRFSNLFALILSSYLLLSIKPYIFFALLPGTSLWFVGYRTSQIKNQLLRTSLIPLVIVISALSGYLMLRVIGDTLGEFSVNKVVDKAIVTQQDLKQDYYQGSSFDIGEIDPTIPGMLSKAPKAINAALFRPYLWESNNAAMLLSGLENLILLLVAIVMVIRLRGYYLILLMFRQHVLFFSVFFSLFFAFSIGLTTSNFGSLVRYKIPAIPFFAASLFIIFKEYNDMLKRRESGNQQPEPETAS